MTGLRAASTAPVLAPARMTRADEILYDTVCTMTHQQLA
jgi:hypothetical protein